MKLILFFVFLLSSLPVGGRQVFTYDPAVVELSGVLNLQTFPGPPNFESIKAGDSVERHFYLKLHAPIDVSSKGENPEADVLKDEQDVRILQLSIDAENEALWARFRDVGKGRHVKIKGTLIHRSTGHHHSRIVLLVDGMELLNP